MGRKGYDKDYLICELHRFVRKNGRNPTQHEMTPKNGYPAGGAYTNHFGSFNNAIEIARIVINRYCPKLDGTETCSYCGKRADEIPNFIAWRYDKNDNNKRYCDKHGKNSDYVTGNLDINSEKGLGRAGEILVVKTLEIGKEHDCNRESCNYPIDMYNEKYGKIDVKTSLLSYKYNTWQFLFGAKKLAKTYICIGLSSDRSKVEHVWVVPNTDEIINQQILSITNSFSPLYNNKHWEVDPKPYNDIWQKMLDNYHNEGCNTFVNKQKDTYIEATKED